MKKTLSILSLGAGMLAALSSCTSSRNADILDYEEAMPMSEVVVGDGELPPWVLEGDDTIQIPAGDYTPEADGSQYIPEQGEIAVADTPTAQNQPAIAHDDTHISSEVEDDYDPYATSTTSTTSSTSTGAVAVAPDTTSTTQKPKQTSTTTKPTTTKPLAANNKKKIDKKKVKKVNEPSLVVYKVRPGDSLYEIAKRSNTTIDKIRKASGIKGDIIHPGQKIKVPFTPSNYKAEKKKETPVTKTYVVKKGDMLSKVAAKHGVTTAALLKANNLTMAQAGKVRPGTKIIIPGKTSTVSKKTKSSSSKKRR